MSIKLKLLRSLAMIGVSFGLLSGEAQAQSEAQTFSSSFSVPVYNSLDENGVDLVTGTWRVATPTISIGEGDESQAVGLEWTGKSWRHIGSPSMWRDDGKYIVQFRGASHEFNGRSKNFSKREPIDGSSLECEVALPSDTIAWCRFFSRDGDEIFFSGIYSTLSGWGSNYGFSAFRYGNLGISQAAVSRASHGSPPLVPLGPVGTGAIGGTETFGYVNYIIRSVADYDYNKVDYTTRLAGLSLKITTPNNNANDEHYLRPKSTTQTVTDDFGNVWRYSFNGNRELTSVARPGGLATLSATYYDNGKVKTITTPAGTWNYSYTTPGDDGTTTVVNPEGATTYVRYNRDHGYVREARDPANRTTYYDWNDTTRRLDQIRYPGGTRTTFLYDGRGNVTRKTDFPRTGTDSLVWQAGGFPASCDASNRANCNKPRWVIDPKGFRTDFEFTRNIAQPTKVIRPAPTSTSPRPTVTYEYDEAIASGSTVAFLGTTAGLVRKMRVCPTQAECVGSPDEVVTDYKYALIQYTNSRSSVSYQQGSSNNPADFIEGSFRVLFEEAVTSGGETRRTCHNYDNKGRRISSTPPLAGSASCPFPGATEAVAKNASPPEVGPAKTTPTFPDVSGGGTPPGGGGGDDPIEPCLLPGSQVQCY